MSLVILLFFYVSPQYVKALLQMQHSTLWNDLSLREDSQGEPAVTVLFPSRIKSQTSNISFRFAKKEKKKLSMRVH